MGENTPRWEVSLLLNRRTEIIRATVDHVEPDGQREIVKMLTGPFDSPEDILCMLIELIEHAEWKGYQPSLPGTVP